MEVWMLAVLTIKLPDTVAQGFALLVKTRYKDEGFISTWQIYWLKK